MVISLGEIQNAGYLSRIDTDYTVFHHLKDTQGFLSSNASMGCNPNTAPIIHWVASDTRSKAMGNGPIGG